MSDTTDVSGDSHQVGLPRYSKSSQCIQIAQSGGHVDHLHEIAKFFMHVVPQKQHDAIEWPSPFPSSPT